jgi:hypothetical protein
MKATLNFDYTVMREEPKMRLLPESFYPSEQDVLCGRGRKIFMHVGNQSFRQLVLSRLQDYSDAATKLEKSCIIGEMVNHVLTNSPHGGFVKRPFKDGRWYQLRDYLSRERTSQAFRDALSDQYRSSNDPKKQHRNRMPHQAVSEGSSQACLHAQLNRPSENNAGAKANNLVAGQSVFKDPLFLKHDKEIEFNQPSSHSCSLRNFEWASKNVALLEASDEFKRIEPEKGPEIEAPESTFELGQATEQAVIDDRSIFDRLVLLVDRRDNGDDPFEPNPLPAQSRYAVY